MKKIFKFRELNPIVSFTYLIILFLFTMLSFNPIIIAISYLFSVIYCFMYLGKSFYKGLVLNLVIIVLMGIINPLISHNGNTVLFTLINKITLESMIFGIVSGFMVSSVINLSRVLSFIIDTSKFNYLFGWILPKTSLVLSISYNYIPRLKKEYQEIDDSLKALGYYASKKRKDIIRSKLKGYSMLITWSLENSIEVADSMVSRGYTTSRRSHYMLTKFRLSDYLFLLIFLVLGFFGVYYISKFNVFTYYPNIS